MPELPTPGSGARAAPASTRARAGSLGAPGPVSPPASRRDLLEAHAWTRRRVVAAYLTGGEGAPVDRRRSSVAPVVVGLVVALLLLTGSAVVAAVHQSPPLRWADGDLLVGRSSGQRFLSLDGVLHPVLNTTSARLALPAQPGLRVLVVDDATLAGARRGPILGIPGAPDALPSATQLSTTWSSCVVGGGTRTSLAFADAVGGDRAAALMVVAGSTPSLVVAGHVLAIAPSGYAAVKQYLGQASAPVVVPARWLALFRAGPALAASSLTFARSARLGAPLPVGSSPVPGLTTSGQLLHNRDRGGAGSLVLADGLVPLTPFAAAVYEATAPDGLGRPVEVSDAELARLPTSPSTGVVPADWPSELPRAGSGIPCAVLDAETGRVSAAQLVLLPVSSPAAAPSRTGRDVAPGHGALVRATETGTGGPVYLVDDSGTAYAITDPSAETLGRLGYASIAPVAVPPSWLALWAVGPAVGVSAASEPSSAGSR